MSVAIFSTAQTFQKMSAATSSTNMATSIRLSSLPDGLFESQLRDFFNQFGTVTAVRLMRSKKVGGCIAVLVFYYGCRQIHRVASHTFVSSSQMLRRLRLIR